MTIKSTVEHTEIKIIEPFLQDQTGSLCILENQEILNLWVPLPRPIKKPHFMSWKKSTVYMIARMWGHFEDGNVYKCHCFAVTALAQSCHSL